MPDGVLREDQGPETAVTRSIRAPHDCMPRVIGKPNSQIFKKFIILQLLPPVYPFRQVSLPGKSKFY